MYSVQVRINHGKYRTKRRYTEEERERANYLDQLSGKKWDYKTKKGVTKRIESILNPQKGVKSPKQERNKRLREKWIQERIAQTEKRTLSIFELAEAYSKEYEYYNLYQEYNLLLSSRKE